MRVKNRIRLHAVLEFVSLNPGRTWISLCRVERDKNDLK